MPHAERFRHAPRLGIATPLPVRGIAVENPGLDFYFDGMDDGVYLTRNFN